MIPVLFESILFVYGVHTVFLFVLEHKQMRRVHVDDKSRDCRAIGYANTVSAPNDESNLDGYPTNLNRVLAVCSLDRK